MDYGHLLATGVACVFSLITSLIAWGLKNQLNTQKTEFKLELSLMELRLYDKMDAIYARKPDPRIGPPKLRAPRNTKARK